MGHVLPTRKLCALVTASFTMPRAITWVTGSESERTWEAAVLGGRFVQPRSKTMKKIIFATIIGALSLSSSAHAQNGTVSGAAGGAVAGAVIGGPVGDVVGGVGGAVVGTLLAPPPAEVRSYVVKEQVPSVTVE